MDGEIQEDKLLGKYVRYYDKDSKHRVGRVVRIASKTITIKDWEKIRHRIDKKRVLCQVTPKKQRMIVWKAPKRRGRPKKVVE